MAKTRGLPLPDVIGEYDTICIKIYAPDDPILLRSFWGHIWMLDRWYTHEHGQAGDTRAAQVAAIWRPLLYEAHGAFFNGERCDTMDCCDDILTRMDDMQATLVSLLDCCRSQREAVDITIINYRETTYNTYYTAPLTIHDDVPDTTYNEDTSDDATALELRRDALCDAVNRYVRTILEDTRIRYETGTGLIVAGVAVAGGLVAGIVAATVGAALLALSEAIFSDDDALADVVCCMYAGLEDAAITEANFQASLDSCGFASLSNQEQIRGVISAANQDSTNWLLFLKQLGQSFKNAGNGWLWENCLCIDVGPCGDCTTSTQYVEDSTSDPPGMTWFGRYNGSSYETGVYSTGSGWLTTPHMNLWDNNYYVEVRFANPICISQMQVRLADASLGTLWTDVWYRLYDYQDNLIAEFQAGGTALPYAFNWRDEWDIVNSEGAAVRVARLTVSRAAGGTGSKFAAMRLWLCDD